MVTEEKKFFVIPRKSKRKEGVVVKFNVIDLYVL
jgi:hypothetical protein